MNVPAVTFSTRSPVPVRGRRRLGALAWATTLLLTTTLAFAQATVTVPGISPAPAAPAADEGSAPAFNWVLPIFTDKEGYRSMTLRGSEVRPAGGAILVTDLSITIFIAQAKPVVDSMLLSPSARFMPKENRATGDSTVRFIRDDIEVTGVGWVYDHAAKKVSLHRNVRVTFKAQLKDILK